MTEGTNTPVEVFEWLSYEPEAGRRAFRINPDTENGIVVELSTVTKMVTSVLRFDPIFMMPRRVHRADWFKHLDGTTLNTLKEALG